MRAFVDHALRSLLRRAEQQGGCVTLAQAWTAGLTPAEVSTLLRRGVVTSPRSGVLALAPSPSVGALDPGAACTLEPALLRHPDAAASHETAARAWELPLIGRSVGAPQTLTRPGTRPRTPASAVHGRVLTSTLPPGHVVRREPWLPATSPARTVVDLARTRGVEDGVVAADAAAYAGLLDRDSLGAVLEDCRHFPGIGRGSQVLTYLDPRAESPLESLSRLRLRAQGLELETQVTITDPQGRFVARVDFLLDGCVIGEADGRGKYSTPADLWAEKQREDGARALGFGVVRWGWDDMWLRSHGLASQMLAARANVGRIVPGVRLDGSLVIRRAG